VPSESAYLLWPTQELYSKRVTTRRPRQSGRESGRCGAALHGLLAWSAALHFTWPLVANHSSTPGRDPVRARVPGPKRSVAPTPQPIAATAAPASGPRSSWPRHTDVIRQPEPSALGRHPVRDRAAHGGGQGGVWAFHGVPEDLVELEVVDPVDLAEVH